MNKHTDINALYLDAGNTAVKAAYFDSVNEVIAYEHGNYQTDQLLQRLYRQRPFEQIFLASVYHAEFNSQVLNWCEQQTIKFVQIPTGSKFDGLVNGYDQVGQMGVDRWLSMMALWHQRHRRFLVVSLGSALTCDLVETDGKHQGGIIMPGMQMMQNSLLQNTAAVRFQKTTEFPQQILQKNTAAAVISGTVYAMIAIIEKIQKTYALEADEIILTGGLAMQIAPLVDTAVTVQQNLVINGIACWHQKGENL